MLLKNSYTVFDHSTLTLPGIKITSHALSAAGDVKAFQQTHLTAYTFLIDSVEYHISGILCPLIK